ncbi:MAG: 2,3,4,5-tetrahydropyridine-2,6-dicarboxylate N-succinyltransferase [Proteobacteria bacterium]|nr:2,3,4,5-tetrahydropyridine-2,6-dicarboxylate N-succinyltransferase [Pseudomonadota bacterium]
MSTGKPAKKAGRKTSKKVSDEASNKVSKKVGKKKVSKKVAEPAGKKVGRTAGKTAVGATRAATGPVKKKAAPAGPGPDDLRFMIDSAFERRTMLTLDEIEGSTRPAVERVIAGIESGEFRVAEPDGQGGWAVNEWLKKAVLLYFRTQDMELVESYPAPFWDKVPARFADFDEAAFRRLGARVVPGAIVRRGAHIGRDVVLMPSFVNIGAHVGEGTMVDTWATVGSCAQVGRHCHLSGGAGIGGVLEPLQATPTIIEDHCFIGARSEVVEGFIVGHHSVIGMGVFLGQSTRVYNRMTGEISYGSVPPGSVVVSGQLPAKDGSHSLYCAVIVKQVDARTRSKTSINDLLRGLAE